MALFNPEWLESVPAAGESLNRNSEYRRGLGELARREENQLAGVLYWTMLFGRYPRRISRILRGGRFVSRISAGFIEEFGGRFGIIVQSDYPSDLSSLDHLDQYNRQPSFISIANHAFPVIERQSVAENYSRRFPEMYSPSQARTACWVRVPRNGYQGWLLPRHALDDLNSIVGFVDGGYGRVIYHFGECIDAVVCTTTASHPANLQPHKASWPVLPGQPLIVEDSPGNYIRISVIHVDLNLGVLRNLQFPVRFSTDWSGRPGLSGALMTEPVTGEPAGLFLGAIKPMMWPNLSPEPRARPSILGCAQSCFQLESISEMEFYL